MELFNRPVINWIKTGERLALLRYDNNNLRRYVCFYNKKLNEEKSLDTLRPKYTCFFNYDCLNCNEEMDKSISVQELANVFGKTRDVITNWETGKTMPDIEDLLLYSKITGLDINDIVIFDS
ncbi:MAG: helix-turn-helix transcriptional regulator [Acholeplasmatales bacterium]|nr:helix-turn-helix transcriptional regulator [Acholeplasmatales bacterium]